MPPRFTPAGARACRHAAPLSRRRSVCEGTQVKYSEQFSEELHLPVEKLDFGETKPQITFDPANCGFSHQVSRGPP